MGRSAAVRVLPKLPEIGVVENLLAVFVNDSDEPRLPLREVALGEWRLLLKTMLPRVQGRIVRALCRECVLCCGLEAVLRGGG